MENLRYLLYQYRTTTALQLGDRFVLYPRPGTRQNLEEGYMAGSAYILSRKAVDKFAKIITTLPQNDDFFRPGAGEDFNMGRILSHCAIFVDTRDEMLQKRFFPVSITVHLTNDLSRSYLTYSWYSSYLYFNVSQGSLRCCSDVPIAFHYVKPKTNFFLEFLVYRVQPFGLERNLTEKYPKKLTLNEIIEASDGRSFAPNFLNHKDYHKMDSDEIF